MVKTLLFSLFMAIFATIAGAQSVAEPPKADDVVPLSDTVAYIYIINNGDQQLVRCITYYGIRDVRDILLEFFNAMLYPAQIQKKTTNPSKLKRT